jgi:hypothetical protein
MSFQVQQSRVEVDQQKLRANIAKCPEYDFADEEGARKFVDKFGILYLASECYGGYAGASQAKTPVVAKFPDVYFIFSAEEHKNYSSKSMSDLIAKKAAIQSSATTPNALATFLKARADITVSSGKTSSSQAMASTSTGDRTLRGGSPHLVDLVTSAEDHENAVQSYRKWYDSVVFGVNPTVISQKWTPVSDLFPEESVQKQLLHQIMNQYRTAQEDRISVLRKRILAIGDSLVDNEEDRTCRVLLVGPVGAGKSSLADLAINALTCDPNSSQMIETFRKRISSESRRGGEDGSSRSGGIEHQTTLTKSLIDYELSPGLEVLDFIGVRPHTNTGDEAHDLKYLKYALQGRVKRDKEVGKSPVLGSLKHIASAPDTHVTPDVVVLVVQADMEEYLSTIHQITGLVKLESVRRANAKQRPLRLFLCVTHMDKVR